MYLLSYSWHGIYLNDYDKLNYPKELFLIFAILVYLIIGFVVAKATDFSLLTKYLKKKPIVRGVIAGAACGVVLFIMATVIGVSFSKGLEVKNLLFDVSWQMMEQMIGGMVVGIVHLVVFDPSVVFEDQ
jgi:H+/Cl- antiporter ClcA